MGCSDRSRVESIENPDDDQSTRSFANTHFEMRNEHNIQ